MWSVDPACKGLKLPTRTAASLASKVRLQDPQVVKSERLKVLPRGKKTKATVKMCSFTFKSLNVMLQYTNTAHTKAGANMSCKKLRFSINLQYGNASFPWIVRNIFMPKQRARGEEY